MDQIHKMKTKIEKFRVLLILLVDQTDIILNRGKIKTHLKNVYQFFKLNNIIGISCVT